jgi:carbamoyltransferase
MLKTNHGGHFGDSMRVMGISGYHDSSAVLIEDGKIICYLKEERLSGEKRDRYPLKSCNFIMENYQVDWVAVSGPYPNEMVLREHLRKYNKNLKIHDYTDDHHKCHASNAFYNSGFDECLVFVIDRNGSKIDNILRESETVFECSYPANIVTLHKNYWIMNEMNGVNIRRIDVIRKLRMSEKFSFNADSNMSIVKVYESATTLIGQHPLENGKTMGLSSYGTDSESIELFYNNRPNDTLFVQDYFIRNLNMPVTLRYNHIDSVTQKITKQNYQFYADYAYQVQRQTQKQVEIMVGEWVEKTGIKNVCITGGYGLNVVSNGNLLKCFPDVSFYFDPLADDSGNSIGAAKHLYYELTQDKTINKQTHTFYHGTKKDLQSVGKSCNIKDIAKLISEGKTVAVMNGLAEAGPRALGNRSILFDARNPDAKDIVNSIKNREWYRPFAGMILEEYFQDYFVTHGLTQSRNMTVSFDCKKSHLIPGVIHVDNSCRIQTVNKNISHIYLLLNEFMRITNCPVLLNTSFNLAGEPLVETQEDAIRCFENSGLNVLWFPEINKCLIKEEE